MRRTALRQILARQFMLVAALPLLIFALLWTAVALPDAVERIGRENEQTAALLRSQIEAVLAVPQRSLEIASALIADSPPRSERTRALMLRTLELAPAFEALYVADARGVIEDAHARPSAGVRGSDLIGLDLASRPFYALARDRHSVVWSDTFLSPLTGQVTAVLAQPIGQRLLVADVSLAGLAKELAQHERPREAIVVLLDGKGRAIVHPQQQLAAWQENLSHLPLVQAALRGRPGTGEIEFGGERWMATVAQVQPAGWYVLVAQRRALLFAPLLRIGVVAGVSALLALAVAVAMALRMAANESERYRRLVAAAQAMVDDPQHDAEVELGSEETHALWLRLRALLDQLKDQEQRATSAQRNLQSVLDAATEVAVVATDTSGAVRLFNRGAEKMLGYRAEEVIGKIAPAQWHDPQEVAARAVELSARLNRPVAGREAFVTVAREVGHEVRDWTFVRRDGSRLLVSLAMTAVRDAQGTLSGFLGVAIDQTQRQRAAELELARERAEVASQAKSEFLSRVSHELRTPLNAMLGYAQLLALGGDNPLSSVQRERIARIETAGWHLVRLVDDVLDLSRIESGRIALMLEAVELHSVIGEAVRLVVPQAAARDVLVTPPTPDAALAPLQMVRADRTRLRQVLVNLLSNAVKYNDPGGKVEIVLVESDPAQLGVKVIDTGRGMDALQLDRLFAPFDRLGLEATNIEGTGIGLVITKRLVELMNGRIEVQSVPQEGSSFTVTLPRSGLGHLPGESATLDRASADPAICGDVVYVEDNEVNAILMSEVFALRPGCRLHLGSTLAEGRALIERMLPCLVLVDMHLPDGSGLSLLDWLRADARLRDIPTMVVSADATGSQQDAAARAGARAYLTKPIHVAQALQAIDAILSPR